MANRLGCAQGRADGRWSGRVWAGAVKVGREARNHSTVRHVYHGGYWGSTLKNDSEQLQSGKRQYTVKAKTFNPERH